MSINAIWDAIKELAQSLQVATIFPSSLFVLVNTYVILPQFFPKIDNASSPAIAIITALVLTLSYALYAFNFPLIRFLEGYKIKDNWLGKTLITLEKQRRQNLLDRIKREGDKCSWHEGNLAIQHPDLTPQETRELIAKQNQDWKEANGERIRLEAERDREFPLDDKAVLPTSLGNTIAAFEDYPRTRYGIESIVFWPRFLPILRDTKYLEFVAQEKTMFDFLLNVGLVLFTMGLEATYLTAFMGQKAWSLLLLAITLGISAVFYLGLVIAGRQWGTTVRVAFDLYRSHLHRQLNLKTDSQEMFEQETRRWQDVSAFFLSYLGIAGSRHFLTQWSIEERERAAMKK